jgi:hypothetical protein
MHSNDWLLLVRVRCISNEAPFRLGAGAAKKAMNKPQRKYFVMSPPTVAEDRCLKVLHQTRYIVVVLCDMTQIPGV